TPTTTTAPTTTAPSNGVSTPEPFQPGITTSCNKFHKVVSGDQCSVLATKYSLSLSISWSGFRPSAPLASLCGSISVCVSVSSAAPSRTRLHLPRPRPPIRGVPLRGFTRRLSNMNDGVPAM
ncbi:lysM domain-containing protein, partial [Colletotrichum asianum]